MSRSAETGAPRAPDRRPSLPGQEVLPFLKPSWPERPAGTPDPDPTPAPARSGDDRDQAGELVPEMPRLLLEVPIGRGRSELYSYTYSRSRREGRDPGPRVLELVRESDGWTLAILELCKGLECACDDFQAEGQCRHSRAVEATGLLQPPRMFPLHAGGGRR